MPVGTAAVSLPHLLGLPGNLHAELTPRIPRGVIHAIAGDNKVVRDRDRICYFEIVV